MRKFMQSQSVVIDNNTPILDIPAFRNEIKPERTENLNTQLPPAATVLTNQNDAVSRSDRSLPPKIDLRQVAQDIAGTELLQLKALGLAD